MQPGGRGVLGLYRVKLAFWFFFSGRQGDEEGEGGGRASRWVGWRGGHMVPQSHAGELLLVQKNNHTGGIILHREGLYQNFHHYLL